MEILGIFFLILILYLFYLLLKFIFRGTNFLLSYKDPQTGKNPLFCLMEHDIIEYDKKTRIGRCNRCGRRLRHNINKSYPQWIPISETEPDYGETYEYSKRELANLSKVEILSELLPVKMQKYKTLQKNKRQFTKLDGIYNDILSEYKYIDWRDPEAVRDLRIDMVNLDQKLEGFFLRRKSVTTKENDI